MAISDKSVQEFKRIFEKDTGKSITDEQAHEYSHRLSQFAEILLSVAKQELDREKRLKDEPNGFSLHPDEGIFTCLICYKSISGEDTWWDKNGLRCKNCQQNIKDGVISSDICKKSNTWFKDWQLKSDFGIHAMTAKKMRREGKLIGRELKDKTGKTYFTVYMVDDNKEFLKSAKAGLSKSRRTNPLFVDSNGEKVF